MFQGYSKCTNSGQKGQTNQYEWASISSVCTILWVLSLCYFHTASQKTSFMWKTSADGAKAECRTNSYRMTRWLEWHGMFGRITPSPKKMKALVSAERGKHTFKLPPGEPGHICRALLPSTGKWRKLGTFLHNIACRITCGWKSLAIVMSYEFNSQVWPICRFTYRHSPVGCC